MSFQGYTDALLNSGNVSGATLLSRHNGQIWATSGDSLSESDCKSVWVALKKGDCKEIMLRGALHKNRMPGMEGSMLFASGKSGVAVGSTGKVILLGVYEGERGHSAGRCVSEVGKVVECVRQGGY